MTLNKIKIKSFVYLKDGEKSALLRDLSEIILNAVCPSQTIIELLKSKLNIEDKTNLIRKY